MQAFLWIVFACLLIVNSQSCDRVNVENVVKHENHLMDIARANGNNRASATPGYQMSVDFIVSELENAGYTPEIQPFTYLQFSVVGEPSFTQSDPENKIFVHDQDFRVVTGSASGNLNARLVKVSHEGCNAGDYQNFPAGAVALVARGGCTFSHKLELANAVKAAALIIHNNIENEGHVFSATVQESNISLPVLTVSYAVGMNLARSGSARIVLKLETKSELATGYNVLADTSYGAEDSIIVVGSHLDSVRVGPGINDNGSGTSSTLELALLFARCYSQLQHKIRFAWWGAEELGLVGSRYYVRNLNPTELNKIILNLNYDMIGSPNFMYAIYDGRRAAVPIREKCTLIQALFEQHLDAEDHFFVSTPFNGRSDYGPFIEVGIPAGGLFTGAEGRKTVAEADMFGGVAGQAYDICYHRACDDLSNLNIEALETMAQAAYSVTKRLADDPFLKEKFFFDRNVTTTQAPFIYYPTHLDAFNTF